MAKTNWFIQLPFNFFSLPEHETIANREHGEIMLNFYLRLLLLSIKHNGYLMISDDIPYDDDTLASLYKLDIDLVDASIDIFIKFGLIEQHDDIFYMSRIKDYVKTTSTERVKKYREKQKETPSNDNETPLKHDETLHSVSSNNVKPNETPYSKNKIKNNTKNNKNIDTPSITPPREKTVGGKKQPKKIVFPTDNDSFNRFWTIYPKKVAIARAYKAFDEFKCDDQFVDDISIILQKQQTSYEWQRENGRYIPSPEKYIRESRFQDELTYTQETPLLDPETEQALDNIFKKMRVGGARYGG